MRFILSILFIFTTAFMFERCGRQNDIDAQRLSWLTEDPLSIPYRIRLQRYERPNLIRNGSFETGRTFAIDSGRNSFVIDGWQQIGQNIEWVNISQDSIYGSEEVFSGNRSIKIVRKKAYETDDLGEGIISDFIRVIPGNYDFYFYTRLSDIMPNRSRLGTRMYDAIEFELQFYDRNKILLNSRQYFPQLDQYIDNGNKSLSFANYLNIPSFGWGKIIGKSYAFPFPDGDIPSSANYIKIYLGLKGTGTMWIDSVTLRYNVKNFSVSERMNAYTDTSFFMRQNIIPTPKKLRHMESVIYYASGMNAEALPIIVIPPEANGLTLEAADLLRDQILKGIDNASKDDIGREDIRVLTNITTSQLNDSKLVFSLGNTSIYRRYQEIMPVNDIAGHDQGYFIYTSNDISNLVFLNGNADIGNYYAALTAIQLFDRKQPVFHNARIIDFPDFESRHYMITGWNAKDDGNHAIQKAEELIKYKFNGVLLDGSPGNTASILHTDMEPSLDFYLKNDLLRVYSMISLKEIYPDSMFNKLEPYPEYNHADMLWLKNTADDFLSAGVDGIILAPYFQLPSDTSLCYQYPLQLPDNHVLLKNLIMEIQSNISTSYPGRVFQYCPPLFNNELMDLSMGYYSLDSDIEDLALVWSGSSFFSTRTDDADIDRFIDLAGGARIVFFDNSLIMATQWGQYNGAYPYYSGKLKLYNIFEPFGNTDLQGLFSRLDHSHIFINYAANSEISLIRLATAADFSWNVDQYDPYYSLWKVLVMRYGIDVARELIIYANKYAEMLEILLRMRNNEQMTRNIKNGQDKLEELDEVIRGIENKLGDTHPLATELRSIHAYQNNQFDHYQINASAE